MFDGSGLQAASDGAGTGASPVRPCRALLALPADAADMSLSSAKVHRGKEVYLIGRKVRARGGAGPARRAR
jgi:hypothetical protein